MTGVSNEEPRENVPIFEELECSKDSEFWVKYIMKNQFAKGSYGTVWVASPKEDPQSEYAVKVIDRTKLKEKDQESLRREVQILKELQDLPNIIPLIEYLEEPRYLYMVQFYAQGGDLFRRLTQRKQYTEKNARDIAVTLFQTLDDMHIKHKIVHRDLKPENLLLEDMLTEKIYFADFGFARHVPDDGLTTRCGTPAFVAPEIILGRRYKTSVDMWSIGVILFMMLGGYPPFHMEGCGSDLRMLFRKIRAGDWTFHESQWRTVSPEVKRLISRLLTVDPQYRYTAREALDCDWVAKMDGRKLSQIDLFASLTTLKKFDGRLSLKAAMNAVKFAMSADFWNPEAITFSRQTRIQVINDQLVNEALSGPAKIKFDDEYEVIGKIRKGSCATVYECRHKKTKEIFAAKIIRRAKLKASEDEFVLNEVSIMQSLSGYGEYIVQLLDFYEEPDYFYLVMDNMGGGDVFDRIMKKSKYTEYDARKLTKTLLKATRCMHEAGVAHRDIKPQNLLLKVRSRV
jgi:calcium/calmodulin-dependent protein kinase I